ncbi:hypothetical protein D1AOALGA4SA_3038 [Olavius algarvensis Delta 1 endosymbiont]|nr:hypothetical protein D1AOALGA4SA_3038 [Olavius algarvensis Delta 1 endosymbiont]
MLPAGLIFRDNRIFQCFLFIMAFYQFKIRGLPRRQFLLLVRLSFFKFRVDA